MGLDVVMIGELELPEARKEPEFRILINYLVRNFPEHTNTDFGQSSPDLAAGHRIGGYSDLHVLRGLAVACEATPGNVSQLSEADFDKLIAEYYENARGDSTFPHLIEHPDDEGYYAPIPFDRPISIGGTITGQSEPISVTVGSSPGLLAELDRLNTVLQVPGDLGELGEAKFDAAVESHRWPTAAYVWGILRYYVRESSGKFLFVQFC
ncbi:MAG: hypothetical protein ABI411_04590 [Tahibacter sp.]